MKRLIGGQPLHTKDESVFSDASVICVGNSGKSITYQIKTEHGNIGVLTEQEVEHWFDIHTLNTKIIEPTVSDTTDGFSLTVAFIHAKNIKEIVPADLYDFEEFDSTVGVLTSESTTGNGFQIFFVSDFRLLNTPTDLFIRSVFFWQKKAPNGGLF